MNQLAYFPEPKLMFQYGQSVEDPRDGLTLFGPLDKGKPYGIKAGVIGTKQGIQRFKSWIKRIQMLVSNDPPRLARPPFPGFEAVFGIPWSPEPVYELNVDEKELTSRLFVEDKYQRIYNTVDLYAKPIVETHRNEESRVDVWFVIVPDDVYKYCRPKSNVEAELRIESGGLSLREAKGLLANPILFDEIEADTVPFQYELNFHNQLKARLLEHEIPTQIVRESTIAPDEVLDSKGRPLRDLKALESAIAWHLSTATFYKAGGRPWKISGIRKGVCYIGIVFKRDERTADPQEACCAAQMFLDSGDGVVFRGNVGPWYTGEKGDFHLKKDAAKDLVSIAVESYRKSKGNGKPPNELFLHGKVRFNDEEWEGFQSAVDRNTKLVGVRIQEERGFKLFRMGKNPVLRGTAYVRDDHMAYLWTRGLMPRLRTYPGREVPNPLLIDLCRGKAEIGTVLADILALTKLNYNACLLADGEPVTLKFADAVGEILTAGPLAKIPPLPFRHYI